MIRGCHHAASRYRILLLLFAFVSLYCIVLFSNFKKVSHHTPTRTNIESEVSMLRKLMNKSTQSVSEIEMTHWSAKESDSVKNVRGREISDVTEKESEVFTIITSVNFSETDLKVANQNENIRVNELKNSGSNGEAKKLIEKEYINKGGTIEKNHEQNENTYKNESKQSKALSKIPDYVQVNPKGSVSQMNEDSKYKTFEKFKNVNPRVYREKSKKDTISQSQENSNLLKVAVKDAQESQINAVEPTDRPLANRKTNNIDILMNLKPKTFSNFTMNAKVNIPGSSGKGSKNKLLHMVLKNDNESQMNAAKRSDRPLGNQNFDNLGILATRKPKLFDKFTRKANVNLPGSYAKGSKLFIDQTKNVVTNIQNQHMSNSSADKLLSEFNKPENGTNESRYEMSGSTSVTCKRAIRVRNKTKIGILIPSSTRNIKSPSLENLSLFNTSLPSIYKTLEEQFVYRIYIGIDEGDYLQTVQEQIKSKFDCTIPVIVHGKNYVKSVNAIANQAYVDGMDYFVRVNDDTMFITQNWTSIGVAKLKQYHPPNIGVVGPTCNEGNTRILTHDMVHRTHLEIFDFYYPPYLENWWTDDWITRVYEPKRSTKLTTWVVKHALTKTRYTVDQEREKWSKTLIQYDNNRLQKYIGCSCSCTCSCSGVKTVVQNWSSLPFALTLLACCLVLNIP